MFMSPMVMSSTCTPNGKTIQVLDPECVQKAFQDLSNESTTVDTKINGLMQRMNELEAFTKFCAQHYPEVVNEFTLATLAKTRLGVKAEKP